MINIKYNPTLSAPLILVNPFLKNKITRFITVMPISHQTEKTVRLPSVPRPNIIAGTHIPNRIFKLLLFRASLMTEIPLPSRASLIAVITSGIPVKRARTSTPIIVLFSPHAVLKKTAERTIPMLVIIITMSAADPIHAQDHDFGTSVFWLFEALLVEAIARVKNVRTFSGNFHFFIPLGFKSEAIA